MSLGHGIRISLAVLALAGARICDITRSDQTVVASAPQFANISNRSQFGYKTNNGFDGRKYFPQPMCGGVAILDFDSDGQPDIFFTNGSKFPEMVKTDPSFHNCLLRNRGGGVFEDVTRRSGLNGANLGYSFGAAVGDYDNDGHPDLFVCNAGRNALYHNNGDGTFSDVTSGSGLGEKPANVLSVSAAWFDYDNDGLLDLVVSNYTVWTPETDIRCSKDGRESYCDPRKYRNVAQRLYRNLGNGKFADVTDLSGFSSTTGKGMGIAIADFDQNGYLDVFIANDTERNLLFLNQGNGTFREAGLLYGAAYNDDARSVSGMGADAKDFNNDGWPDVLYNDLAGEGFGLFENLQGRSFRYASPGTHVEQLSRKFSGWGAGFFDYNNDGWLDIYSANGDVDDLDANARQHDTIWENVEGRGFKDVSQSMGIDFLEKGFQRGSAFADLNGDGALDIVVTSLGEKPRILMNSGKPGNHWLMLKLIGTKSNRDAIGAAVKLTTVSGRKLYNHVTASVGLMSSSDTRLHFGLGLEKGVGSIEIRWPSGSVQKIGVTAADQLITIRETN